VQNEVTAPFKRMIPLPISAQAIYDKLSAGDACLIGDPGTIADSIAYLTDGVPGSLAFWDKPGLDAVRQSCAAIVFIAEEIEPEPDRAFVLVDDPRWYFIETVSEMFLDHEKGTHPSVILGKNVSLPASVIVGANTYIGDNVTIGENSRIGNNCIIHPDTVIGRYSWIKDACMIGSHGLSFHRSASGKLARFPHLGATIIEDYVELGTGSCVVRGMLSNTEIRARTKIGNLVNIGHGCIINEDCWISGSASIGGHAELGKGVSLAMSVTVANSVTVGAGSRVGIGSVVTKTVPADSKLFGCPAQPLRTLKPFGPTPR
jgi:UDP-3-O-[3-hydroxymyristoyl] glucosamine N-acyltransferase